MSFSEWRSTTLGEITRIKGGKRLPKGILLTTEKNDHPYIRIRNLGSSKNINLNSDFEFVDDETFSKISRYIVNQDDVILSIVGTIGLVGKIGKTLDNASLTENCIKFVNLTNINRDFLYYFLVSKYGQDEIKKMTVGAVQPKLPIKNIEKIEIKLPLLDEQFRISSILNSLEEKIELNNRINKTLEEMAQAIFKSWFVDFEPFKDGEFVESEMGKIPQGWNVKELNDFVEINMGQSPSGTSYNDSKEGLVFYQGRTDFGTRFPTVRLYTSEPRKIAEKGDVLLSVRAPVGDINIARERCCIGRGLASVRCRYDYSSFTYYLLMNLKEKFEIFNHEGTVFGSINKESLMRMKSVIPPFEILEKFERIVSKLDSKIYLNSDQMTNLTEIRDSLLPKLMSGEIRVPLEEVPNA